MKFAPQRLISFALAVAGTAAGSACGNTAGTPQAAATGGWSQQTRVSGEYLVTLSAGANAKVIADLYGRFGIKSTQDLGQNLFRVTLTEDPGPATMEKLRAGSATIQAVQPNFVYRTKNP